MKNELDGKRVGFVGGGAMAEAMAGGLVAAGVPAQQILASDPLAERREALTQSLGLRTTVRNDEVVAGSDVVVLAVKPASVDGVLADLEQGAEALTKPLWVSIAAGIPLLQLAGALPPSARVVRAMPNTPALVGAGATVLACNPSVLDDDRALARALFETVGRVWEASNEAQLDAVTGLSGSGPAYVFAFLEALGDAGRRVGLPEDLARELACQTVFGAAKLALDTGTSPSTLRNRVTSPGGTTEAGLKRLEAAGFRIALNEAVEAATERSRELGSRTEEP